MTWRASPTTQASPTSAWSWEWALASAPPATAASAPARDLSYKWRGETAAARIEHSCTSSSGLDNSVAAIVGGQGSAGERTSLMGSGLRHRWGGEGDRAHICVGPGKLGGTA
eukprot:CAMPEP_0179137880 /NCGR_PEP_ID=MMETSP0796-20121207/65805_1 /TAXON_ID=73915 /ORGANISM="Pyrodinium bahamense, Strain pbaha01" /LENGTH=111 /DNA_ID=CAMNT_0020837099 /DNA_START=142 /DNA_END=476 /DNA_ORIENTATION=+